VENKITAYLLELEVTREQTTIAFIQVSTLFSRVIFTCRLLWSEWLLSCVSCSKKPSPVRTNRWRHGFMKTAITLLAEVIRWLENGC